MLVPYGRLHVADQDCVDEAPKYERDRSASPRPTRRNDSPRGGRRSASPNGNGYDSRYAQVHVRCVPGCLLT